MILKELVLKYSYMAFNCLIFSGKKQKQKKEKTEYQMLVKVCQVKCQDLDLR